MQIRSGYRLSVRLGAVAAVGALCALGASSLRAAPPLPAPEGSLLGVRLFATHKDVIRRFGQPSEIQVGSPRIGEDSQIGGTGGPGTPSGGGGGLPGMGGGPMGGGSMGSPAGMPGGRGPMGMPGSPSGGGSMGSPSGMPGGRGPMGMPGSPSGGGSMGGPLSGFGGRRGSDDGPSGPGLPGFPGAGGGAGQEQAGEEEETTWWYHYPKQNRHYAFLFNKDGRVIQIQQYGYKGGTKTRQGVGLGDPLGTVLKRYGWSNDGYRAGEELILRYGADRQLMFQVVKNRVAGITVAIVKK